MTQAGIAGESPITDDTPLSQLTTMRVGGPGSCVRSARSREELIALATELWRDGEPWLLLGGGSNTVVHDDGYPGPVLLVRTSGIDEIADPELPAGQVRVRVAAGEDWDGLVATAVSRGWAGIEALSGFPAVWERRRCRTLGPTGRNSPTCCTRWNSWTPTPILLAG